MLELTVALVIAFFGFMGAMLRCAPFIKSATGKQKRMLALGFGIVILAYIGALLIAMKILGLQAAILCLQVGGNLLALAMLPPLLYIFRGAFKEHIFMLGVVASCQYLLLSVPAYIVSLLDGVGPFITMWAFFGSAGVLMLMTYFPMRRLLIYTVEPFLKIDSGSYWNTICFVPLVFFFAMMFVLWGSETVSSLLQMVSGLFSGSMIIFMCLSIAADNKRLEERRNMEKQLAAQKLHYTELKTRVEDARKTKHDLKHHIAAIRHYMEVDDKAGLQAYCNELAGSMESGSIPYTGNVAADGVLYYYMQQAKFEKIQVQYAGTIKSNGIADVDLCALLGNALDNAVTACKTIPSGRSISVISQSEAQVLSIVVRNSFDGKVLTDGDRLLSRKRDNRTGVGLASMRSICERYGGSMDTSWDDRSFTVAFVLPLKQE